MTTISSFTFTHLVENVSVSKPELGYLPPPPSATLFPLLDDLYGLQKDIVELNSKIVLFSYIFKERYHYIN